MKDVRCLVMVPLLSDLKFNRFWDPERNLESNPPTAEELQKIVEIGTGLAALAKESQQSGRHECRKILPQIVNPHLVLKYGHREIET
jgi:hypothetical protein